MTAVQTSLTRAVFLDQSTPREAQELAFQHQRDIQALLLRVREKVYELTPLLEAYAEMRFAVDALAAARPQHIRCPFPAVKTTVEFVQLAHDPVVKAAKVA